MLYILVVQGFSSFTSVMCQGAFLGLGPWLYLREAGEWQGRQKVSAYIGLLVAPAAEKCLCQPHPYDYGSHSSACSAATCAGRCAIKRCTTLHPCLLRPGFDSLYRQSPLVAVSEVKSSGLPTALVSSETESEREAQSAWVQSRREFGHLCSLPFFFISFLAYASFSTC